MVARGGAEGNEEEHLFYGDRVGFWVMRKFWNYVVVMVVSHCECTELYSLIVTMVTFMLCVFNHNKNNTAEQKVSVCTVHGKYCLMKLLLQLYIPLWLDHSIRCILCMCVLKF